jgi:hypothetical protein
MSNTLVTIDRVTRVALEIAHEKLSFLGTINRDYDDSFAKGGAKIGDSLRIRMPEQFTRTTGTRVMDVQDQTESSVLVAGVEGDVITDMTKSVYNLTGTAGTVVGSSSGDISAITNARAKLNQYLAPKDANRAIQFDSVTMGAIVNGNKALFHDGSQIKEAFREGFISRNAMADWYENEKTWTLTNGDDVAGEVDESAETNFTQGTTTIHVDGLGTTIKKGMVFEWEGLYAVHPETKQAYSHLQQFTVTNADGAVASNEIDITFSPPIYTTGAKQNVATSTGGAVTWTSAGQDGKNIAFFGSASGTYRQNLMYHRDFATFVTADLPIMADAAKCVRRVKDGLALRVWQGSDIRNDELLMRIDILYGWKVLRPDWACRISN